MALRPVEKDFIPLKIAGSDTDIDLTVLAAGSVYSHPVACAYRHQSNAKIAADVIEMRALLVGTMSTPVDLTLRLHRVAIPNDDQENWDDYIDFEDFYLKNIDYSIVDSPGSDLITNGGFTEKASGTAGAMTAGSSTLALDAATDLSSIVAGDLIYMDTTVSGGFGRNAKFFRVLTVNDGADTVTVSPTPSKTASSLAWVIQESAWEKNGGWESISSNAEYFSSEDQKGILSQSVSVVDGAWHLLTFDQAVGKTKDINVRIGSQNILSSGSQLTTKQVMFKRDNALGVEEIKFQPATNDTVRIDNVILTKVTPFWFTDIRRFDDQGGKGAGSGLSYRFTPSADMSGARLSAWFRRWRNT